MQSGSYKERLSENALEIEAPKELIKNFGIYLFPSEDPHTSNANVYALIDGADVLLFDCGNVGNSARLNHNLETFGLGIQNIRKILLTDIHADHFAGASEIQALNPEVEVEAPEKGLAFLLARDPFKTAWYLYPHLHEKHGRYTIPVPRIDGVVRDGNMFTFGKHVVDVLSTPGHSPAATTYIIDSKIAIAGDAYNGGYNESRIGSDMGVWNQTNTKLLKAKFDFIVDGHSPSLYLPTTRRRYEKSVDDFAKKPNGTFHDLVCYW